MASSSASLTRVSASPWPLPMPPATILSSLFGATLLFAAAPDPQQYFPAVAAKSVQMNAVGAGPEKRHGTAVEPEERCGPPARRNVKGLIAGLRDLFFVDQRIDDAVNRPAQFVGIAPCGQLDAVGFDPEEFGEAPQSIGVVAPDQTDPGRPGAQRQHPRGVVIVAPADVIDKGHRRHFLINAFDNARLIRRDLDTGSRPSLPRQFAAGMRRCIRRVRGRARASGFRSPVVPDPGREPRSARRSARGRVWRTVRARAA